MPRKEPSLDPTAAPPLRAERAAVPSPRHRRRSLWRGFGWLLFAAVVFLPLSVLVLRWLPPPITAFMLQSNTRPLQYDWVPAAKVAEAARRAVVASEDQKFWEHDGFDMEAIEKARQHNQRSKKRRGASTISQQTAKNLFLWPGGGYFRKGVEAGITVLIETCWTKQRILEVYLNIAEFGPGIYGVEAAAQAFFGKPAAQLTAAEAARLAAVLPSPRRWSAKAPGPYVQKRQRWILGQMGYGARIAEPEPPPVVVEEVEELGVDEPAAGAVPPERAVPESVPADEPAEMPEAEPAAPPPAEPAAPG